MNIPLIIVGLYVVLLFAISIHVARKQRNDQQTFLLYQGKNNTWVVASSIAGLAIGGASTIGIAENAFSVGLSAGWYDATWAIGAASAAFLSVRFLRRCKHSTVSGLVGDLYGKNTSFAMVLSMCIIQAGIIALQYKAGGSILAALLPEVFTIETGTFFSFLIFMVIAVLGGMGSVSLTNVLNLVLIYIGVITALIVVLTQMDGMAAIQTLVESQPDVPYLSLTEGIGWLGILAWTVVMLGNCNSIQGVVQIGLTGKDDKTARNGYLLGAALMIPIGFICALLGVASKALLPDATASVALPLILMSIPPVLGGITLSGLWAADMGTACSMIIGLATTINNDVFDKMPSLKIPQEKKSLVTKVIIVVSSSITYLIATQMGAILTAMQQALSLAIGTAIVIVFGTLFPKFASKKAGLCTIISSIICIIAWNSIPALAPIFYNVGIFMLIICGGIFAIISAFDKDKVNS